MIVLFSPRALRRTLCIALFVGTVLSMVNEGAMLLHGSASAATWLRIAANYVTPFCVASAGYVSAGPARRTRSRP